MTAPSSPAPDAGGGTDEESPDTNPQEFLTTPRGHVYGIVDDPERDVPAVTADLLAARVPLDGIHVYCCQEGLEALDPKGTSHGLRARITRMVQSMAFGNRLEQVVADLEAGHALIGVAVDDEHKGEVARVLLRHGGHDIVHYGRYTWEPLGSGSSGDGNEPENT